MEKRDEVREFLASRRARLTPEQAGIVSYGTRRVPGLRREEVAQLAGLRACQMVCVRSSSSKE
jgi:hypothetical protein